MGQSKHDQIANRIAKKEGTTYNEGQGPDVQSSTRCCWQCRDEGFDHAQKQDG